MSVNPLVSIVIVSYNTREVLEACIRSVQKTVAVSHEVIVLDNASPDGSANMVEVEFPKVRLVRCKENIGFSPANNLGMEMAFGKYVLLLNPDTLVQAGSVEQWIEAHERVGAAISGPRLLNPDGSEQVSAWQVPDAMDALLELFLLHNIFRRTHYEPSTLERDREVGFVSGAAMLFERTLFQRIGGLDPELFWMEDTDFCERVRKAGGSCYRFQGPTIVHIGGQSSSSDPTRMISNQLVSRIKFARKNDGVLAGFIVAIAMYLHCITRIVAFGLRSLFTAEPRAKAYRYTFTKLNRYVFFGDRSI